MRQAGHVADMGEKRLADRFWWGKMRQLLSPGIGGRIILKLILKL
jgi:hypothetical protein